MTRLSLKIILDDPGKPFHCGAEIAGAVEVVADEEIKAKDLVLSIGYKGKGIAPHQPINFVSDAERKTLFTGDWRPGAYRYPFTLIAPDACTYKGAILNMDWYLRARVVKAGKSITQTVGTVRTYSGFDAEEEKVIELAPGPITSADRERGKAAKLIRKDAAVTPGCLLTSVLLLLGGVFAVWMGLPLLGGIAAFIGIPMIGYALWLSLIGRKISLPELRIGSVITWPGERIPCRITFQARSPIEIKRATLTFKGWEQVKKFTGMHRTTGPLKKHLYHNEEQVLNVPAQRLSEGTMVEIKGEFTVPVTAPCTMDFDNEIKFLWQVEFRIQINGSPTWYDVQPVTVLPRIPCC